MGTRITWSAAYHPNPKAKSSESIKFLKTCFELVLFLLVRSGKNLSLMRSSLITTAIKPAWRWHPSRCSMDVSAEPLWIGQQLGNGHSLVRILFNKLESRFTLFGIISRRPSPARRATMTGNTRVQLINLVNKLICVSLLWEALIGSESRAS